MEDNKKAPNKATTDKKPSRPSSSSSSTSKTARPTSTGNSAAKTASSSSASRQTRPAQTGSGTASRTSTTSNGNKPSRPTSASSSNSSRTTSSSSSSSSRPPQNRANSTGRPSRPPQGSSSSSNRVKNENGAVNNSSNNGSKAPNNKKSKPKSSAKSTAIYLAIILAISAVLSYFVVNLSNDLLALLKDDQEITFIVNDGDGLSQIASNLDDKGVIEYANFFKIFVNISAKNSTFVAGTHTLNSNMDYRGILNQLQKSTAESKANTVTVTVPEGYTIDQIAELMEEKGVCTAESFRETAENYEFNYSFLSDHKDVIYQLEGYLFPDTYNFYVGGSASSVINTMLKNFENKTADLVIAAEGMGMDFHDVVTIASLVEREAAKKDEQQKISGVIHNRLNNSGAYPFLNIDATIQYVAGHRENILQSDLDNDGPYNTYTSKGLTPGAIANPGYGSLYAAVYPEDHGYYFYVAKEDGYHVFTSNLSDHNAAVQQHQR